MNNLKRYIQNLPLTKLLPVLFLAIGLIGTIALRVHKSEPEKAPPRKVSQFVETLQVTPTSEKARISGYGTVEASKDLEIRPQVSGKVVWRHPALEQGGILESGESLFRIDARDYEIAVAQREADLARAEADLKLEQGNQIVAKREFELLGKEVPVSQTGKELALRIPQLKEKRAMLQSAKSMLERAELDLERTDLKTPFNAVVLEENVEEGKFVNAQLQVARLAATDEVYVKVRVPRADLRWLTNKPEQLPVRIFQEAEGDQSSEWKGKFVRVLGDVDPSGRMAQILVAVENPFQTETPLLIGTYVRVEIMGALQDGVIPLPRRALREGKRVWFVTEEQTLDFTQVEPVFSIAGTVYVRGNIRPGTSVVVSVLENPLQGTLVEAVEAKSDK